VSLPASVARLQGYRSARNPFLRALASSSPSRESDEAVETLLGKPDSCHQAEALGGASQQKNQPQNGHAVVQASPFFLPALEIVAELPGLADGESPLAGLELSNRPRPPPFRFL